MQTSTEGGNRWRSFTGDLRAEFSIAVGSSAVVADDHYLYFYARRRPWSQAELTSVDPGGWIPSNGVLVEPELSEPVQSDNGYQVSGVRLFSDVKLSVFDLLGREVAVLVNERKGPGSYEVKFDGSGLASGVYFYRLQAGDFVQSKKLLLLK